MRKLLSSKNIILSGLILLGLSWVSYKPSRADELMVCRNNPQAIGQTREALGEKYREYLLEAKRTASSLPDDMAVKFPIGISCPLIINDSTNPASSQQANSQLEVIGFIDRSGQIKAMTPASLIEMFDRSLETLAQGNSASRNTIQNTLLGDNQSSPAQNVAAIDLIALDLQDQRIYLLPKVRFISVFRDAYNAGVNRTLTPNTHDITRLAPIRRSEVPERNILLNRAIEKLSTAPTDLKVKIPIPSKPIPEFEVDNCSVSSDSPSPSNHEGRYIAIASVSRQSNRFDLITVADLIAVFQAALIPNSEANESISQQEPPSENLPQENFNDLCVQRTSQGVLTIDLIVYDTWDGQTYLVPSIDLNAFTKDALNAVLESPSIEALVD